MALGGTIYVLIPEWTSPEAPFEFPQARGEVDLGEPRRSGGEAKACIQRLSSLNALRRECLVALVAGRVTGEKPYDETKFEQRCRF
jgi:hypothetical protein